MFGYVLPDKNYLYLKDYALFQGVYCGICKSTKKQFGNLPRLSVNYDSVFLSVLVHNLCGEDYTLEKQRCILHPLRKRNMALDDPMSARIAALNVLLLWHKLNDDVIDGGKFKHRAARRLFARARKKAARAYPEYESVIAGEYARLRALELEKSGESDRVADPFGCMMERLCLLLCDRGGEDFKKLCYNVGRWIYLIDALDDLEKDHRSGEYNVFLAAFPDFSDRQSFVEAHRQDLEFSLYTGIAEIEEAAQKLDFCFNADLIRNVTGRGLRVRTKLFLENDCQCKKIRM